MEDNVFLDVSSVVGCMEDDAFIDVIQSRLRTESVVDSAPDSHTEVLSEAVDTSLHRTLLTSENSSMEQDGFLVDVDQPSLQRTEAAMVSTPVTHTEVLRGAVDPSLHRALFSIMEEFLVEVDQSRLHLLRLAPNRASFRRAMNVSSVGLAQRMDETYDRVVFDGQDDVLYFDCFCCCHIFLHIEIIKGLDIVRKIDWCHPRFHWFWSGMTDGCLLHVLLLCDDKIWKP